MDSDDSARSDFGKGISTKNTPNGTGWDRRRRIGKIRVTRKFAGTETEVSQERSRVTL